MIHVKYILLVIKYKPNCLEWGEQIQLQSSPYLLQFYGVCNFSVPLRDSMPLCTDEK